MAKLIYAAIASLDGYTEDATGGFSWARPDEEVHAYVNDMERQLGTYLYGRRMYETMVFWETAKGDGAGPEDEYAEIWRSADKVVYSTTLQEVASARTRLERSFDPDTVRQLKADATRDISVGGAALAAEALGAGLVDEVHLFLNPVSVGGGKPALPRDARVDLELLDEHRFAGGVVHLRYRVAV